MDSLTGRNKCIDYLIGRNEVVSCIGSITGRNKVVSCIDSLRYNNVDFLDPYNQISKYGSQVVLSDIEGLNQTIEAYKAELSNISFKKLKKKASILLNQNQLKIEDNYYQQIDNLENNLFPTSFKSENDLPISCKFESLLCNSIKKNEELQRIAFIYASGDISYLSIQDLINGLSQNDKDFFLGCYFLALENKVQIYKDTKNRYLLLRSEINSKFEKLTIISKFFYFQIIPIIRAKFHYLNLTHTIQKISRLNKIFIFFNLIIFLQWNKKILLK